MALKDKILEISIKISERIEQLNNNRKEYANDGQIDSARICKIKADQFLLINAQLEALILESDNEKEVLILIEGHEKTASIIPSKSALKRWENDGSIEVGDSLYSAKLIKQY